jgi:hypothetical protein
VRRNCRLPEFLRDVSDRLRLPEIIAVPDCIGSPEVAGRISKPKVGYAKISHEPSCYSACKLTPYRLS